MKSLQLDVKKEIILLSVCASFAFVLAFHLSRQPGVLILSDHYSRWYASLKLITDGRSLYDPQNGIEIVSLNPNPTAPVEGSFFYPAHLLLLTLPLVGLPYSLAHFVWLFLIQAFFIAALYLTFKLVGWPRSPNRKAVFMILALLFIPQIQNTIWGQFNSVGMVSLALVYLALRKDRWMLAGFLALGLTFKPQNMLLTLTFLIIWAISSRRRWRFLAGFSLACLGAWLFAEWLEPHWVSSFLHGVRAYSAYLQPKGVLDLYWAEGATALKIALICLSFWLFYRSRHGSPDSLPFLACLTLSLGAWWVIVPMLGMMQLVALPLAVVWLLASLSKPFPLLYRSSLIAFALIYVLGYLGFLYGFIQPDLYGTHVILSEIAYKIIAPALLTLISAAAILAFPDRSAGPPALRSNVVAPPTAPHPQGDGS